MSISPGIVKRLRRHLELTANGQPDQVEALYLAQKLEPRKRIKREGPTRKQVRENKRAERRELRQAVRADCVERAAGRCETVMLAGDQVVRCPGPAVEHDHFFGRARDESVAGSWMLCIPCHRAKTDNAPSRLEWLRRFKLHVLSHGYDDVAEKLRSAILLEQAQHPETTS